MLSSRSAIIPRLLDRPIGKHGHVQTARGGTLKTLFEIEKSVHLSLAELRQKRFVLADLLRNA